MFRALDVNFESRPSSLGKMYPIQVYLLSSRAFMILLSNVNTREINSREKYKFFGHNSEPCGNFWTILRHKLPIIDPDLPIPSNNLNSNVQPVFLNPMV